MTDNMEPDDFNNYRIYQQQNGLPAIPENYKKTRKLLQRQPKLSKHTERLLYDITNIPSLNKWVQENYNLGRISL